MQSSELDRALSESAAEVLESMFFTALVGNLQPGESPSGPWLSARLSFHGNPPGTFGFRTPAATGRKIAASFLGVEEDALSEAQTGEVICELANMLCGSVLSRLEKESRFELSPPKLDPPEAVWPENTALSGAFELEEGPVMLWLALEHAA